MPMREDCRFYDSRTYGSGEVVRMCRLDLAPDAPWKCPEECAKFSRRTYDAGWTVAPLQPTPTPPQPPEIDDADAAQLLDMAEDIINAAGPGIIEQVKRQRDGRRNPVARGADKLRKRRKKR